MHIFHKWRLVEATQYEAIFGAPVMVAPPSSFPGFYPRTRLLYACTKCPQIKVAYIDGHWTLEQLKGAR
jgi:hypothetical protein